MDIKLDSFGRALGESDLVFIKDALDQHAIVSMTDVRGSIIHANDKFCEISGYSRDELIGANHRLLKSDEHDTDFFKKLWKTIAGGAVWSGDIKNYRKNGEIYWVKTTIAPFINEFGKPEKYIGIRTDISDQVQRREELRIARDKLVSAQATQSNFLAAISHDLRTPLNSIIGFSQIMDQKVFGPIGNQKYEEYAQIIVRSAEHLLSLVDDMLDVNKLETVGYLLKNETYHPVEHTREIIKSFEPLCRDKDISIVIEVMDGAPISVTADQKVATQIQNNMLSNALRHVPKGGHVVCRWGSVRENIFFEVEDNGAGFDRMVMENFGQPFLGGDPFRASSSKKTHGLGLYITKKLVEARGGTLMLENKSSGGALIRASWPIEALDAKF